jgi:ribonuclease P protein component
MPYFSFHKNERLAHRKDIDALFSNGRSFQHQSLKVLYQLHNYDDKYPVKILMAVPKKNIKLAVERNRIRRLIRETYRQQKHELVRTMSRLCITLHVAFIYREKSTLTYTELVPQMEACLKRLNQTVMKDSQKILQM